MVFRHKRILLVDDETRIRMLLKKYLENEGFIVEEADSGGQAIRNCYLTDGEYDLMVLDWLLPDMSGIEICKYVKHNHLGIPIMMLSGRSEEKDRIEGFKAGADDYVVKPFSPREVVLRIRSIMARTQGTYIFDFNSSSSNEILIAEIVIQPLARRVLVQRNEVHLTPKEYDLLYFLVTHQEKAFSREELLREVWKSTHHKIYDHRTVDTHIKRLREKLSFFDYPKGSEFIQTLWGYGYMFRTL
ncbi:response regulator transcription factor [Paenibacillus sp. ACRRY]|uniref:response regulator transcription factor n=1 Tax=Paenibacillus sp. ACRRY TaxID=2918208 RepID=UPI001EF42640|nr:response regulator transcription factor [Paenibacillus sp. ACRRY]MCG7381646.1 response regulator transcription factor [Paenibacillus sp. ACRRY]